MLTPCFPASLVIRSSSERLNRILVRHTSLQKTPATAWRISSEMLPAQQLPSLDQTILGGCPERKPRWRKSASLVTSTQPCSAA